MNNKKVTFIKNIISVIQLVDQLRLLIHYNFTSILISGYIEWKEIESITYLIWRDYFAKDLTMLL